MATNPGYAPPVARHQPIAIPLSGGAQWLIGTLIISLALYYFVVLPVNSLMERFKPETEPGKQTKVCPECKSSIPYDATRCAFCTVEQPPLEVAELNTG